MALQLIDLLTPERIALGQHVSSRKRLLELLAVQMDEKKTPVSEREIFDCLCRRERLGSTALGHGVAIPHGRSSAAPNPIGTFVRLAEPIDLGAPDGQPVDLIFGMIVPEHFIDQHLMLLARLAELFSDQAVIEQLRRIDNPIEFYQRLSEWQERSLAA